MNDQQQIRYLELENTKLRAEAAQLRKKIGENSRHARRVNRAYQDALLMAMWKAAGIHGSRDYAKLQGMSQNRWQNAIALLRMARVVTRHRFWAVKDLAIVEQRLTTAKEKALNDADLFFLRHSRHR